jgi:AcrR family transcriptional regulator
MGRKSKAKVRRQEILSHFYDVIIEEGFEGASIAKIAKRMDVNPSLLIHYFSTKDAMVTGLIDYIISTYSPTIFPDFSNTEDPEERWQDVLDVLAQMHWDRIMNHKVFYSCYALGLRMEDIKVRFKNLYQDLIGRLVGEIEVANDASLITVNNPRHAAEWIITQTEGRSFFRNVNPLVNPSHNGQETFKAVVNQVLQSGLF